MNTIRIIKNQKLEIPETYGKNQTQRTTLGHYAVREFKCDVSIKFILYELKESCGDCKNQRKLKTPESTVI